MADVRVTEGRLIAASSESEITTVLVEPDDAIALMMLGHGAGTPIYRPVMVQMADALADQRIATFRYNYPYSESMTTYSPDTIDSLEVLLSTTNSAKSAVADLSLDLPLFLGGRSMSSQVVSLALTREHWPDVRGVVLYVFPMRWHHHTSRLPDIRSGPPGPCPAPPVPLRPTQSHSRVRLHAPPRHDLGPDPQRLGAETDDEVLHGTES